MRLNQDIILHDFNKETGRENDWRGKKNKSLFLANSYERIGNNNKSNRLIDCASFLQFKLNKDEMTMKLHKANFCHVRLCPVCSWRRTLKIFGQTSKVMNEYILHNPKHKFLFLTLTVKNCNASDLSNNITHLFNAFKLLFKYKKVSNITKGYFRGLEVTYNEKEDTFHPHFHIVVAVPSYYTDVRYYINQIEWSKLWQKALKVDYIPVVDVRMVKDTVKGVCEISKYSVKDTDYLKLDEKKTDYLVSVFDKALHHRRLFSFGLEFKKIHNRLNLDDCIDGDLVNTDNDKMRDDLNYIILTYRWNLGALNYFLSL